MYLFIQIQPFHQRDTRHLQVMAPRKKSPSLPQPIPIGNCEVTVETKNFTTELDHNTVLITLSKNTKVKVSVVESKMLKSCDDPQNNVTSRSGIGNFHFVLVNPIDADSQAQSQLQEALNLYARQLPAMNFAANTGKQSTFLKRCVFNGKYCTLLLKSDRVKDFGEVVAAITYQIILADTLYAEVPLAAVSSTYQRKGIGTYLYGELSKRLESAGIRSIFCWGDEESEGFWLKQGFVPIGEVDTKGKARRLPIKAAIRKLLCFPGGSTLLVSHLSVEKSANHDDPVKLCSLRPLQDSLSSGTVQNQGLRDEREIQVPQVPGNQIELRTKHTVPEEVVKNSSQTDEVMLHLESMECGKATNADPRQCSCSSRGEKKRVWESSYTSLKSKKVKGRHQVDCQLDSSGIVCKADGRNISEDKSSSENSGGRSFFDARNSFINSCLDKSAEGHETVNCVWHGHGSNELSSRGGSFMIMLMNIADDAKKSSLSKIIEDLGGGVTSDGSLSTHVVTGKVRKTLNFCTALCSGAWILSPCWLKESFRKGRFMDEMPFILKDEDYELKYKIELKDAVQRARGRPRALLLGYKVCLAAHLEPPLHTLSAIIRSAGGDVTRGLGKVYEASKTIFLACEEDMEEAMFAIKKGIRTFSSEWFMNCIMRQELDLDAAQFAESL